MERLLPAIALGKSPGDRGLPAVRQDPRAKERDNLKNDASAVGVLQGRWKHENSEIWHHRLRFDGA